jgi:hypothetical protein
MRRFIFALVLLASAGCSSSPTTIATPTSPSPTQSMIPTPLSPLVGQWELNRTCAAIVKSLTQAGLADLIPQDIGETLKLPVNAPLPASWDPKHPCADARPPTEHSHTFWADGTFNSYDQNGQQVDDGSYRIVNDHTFIIGGGTPMTFHYLVNGDTIKFRLVMPKECSTKHCRNVLAWAFAVAYSGQTWTRVLSGPHVPSGSGSSG